MLDVKNDLVFQELFGRQKNSKITEHLLSLILNRKVENIDLDLNKRMIGNRIDIKTGRLDIRASFNDGEEADIELQVLPYEYMTKRMLEYWASMYTSKIDRGNNYEILKPCIGILIADYKIQELKDIEKFHTVWNIREKEKREKVLTEDIEFYILEIPKIKEIELNQNELALWLKFIENPKNKGVKEKMEENKYLKQAMEELGYLSSEPDFKRLIDARVGFLRDQDAFREVGLKKGKKEGIKEGKKEGKKEGIKEEKTKIAKKLLMKKMDIKEIAEITELSEKEIKSLI